MHPRVPLLILCALSAALALASCSSADSVAAPGSTLAVAEPATASTRTVPSLVTGTEVKGRVELTTIHVSPRGNDNNSGATVADAVRTITRAVALATPGDTVVLQPGDYPAAQIRGVNGRAGQPITIRPAGGTVTIADGSYDRRAGINIEDSSHIHVTGVRIRRSLWAIDTHRSSNLVIRDIDVDDIGQEALHFRSSTTHVQVTGSRITGTGNRPGYTLGGSGVYVGSSSGTDLTHDIRIADNEIWNTASEGVDVKPGTWNVTIERNRIHDINTLQTGAVVLHLGYKPPNFDPNLVVRNNDIWNITSNTQWADGNAIVVDAAATVTGNRLWNTEHRGVLVEQQFTESNPRNVRINGNVMWNSGRYDIEIRGTAADVTFDNNHSANPYGGPWQGSGNAPATKAVFDAWTMGGSNPAPPPPPPPPPAPEPSPEPTNPRPPTTPAPSPSPSPTPTSPSPGGSTTTTNAPARDDGSPTQNGRGPSAQPRAAGAVAGSSFVFPELPQSAIDQALQASGGVDTVTLPPLRDEVASSTSNPTGPAVARDVQAAGFAPPDSSSSGDRELPVLGLLAVMVLLGYVTVRTQRSS